jgi:SAM-dependent methyltransferase
MPRAGELTYFHNIGEDGRDHSINKPFSDQDTPLLFMDIGLIFSLLPSPPARVLECGCGTGWLSYFLSRKGFDVVGQDCSADAIDLAKSNPIFAKANGNVSFICSDFESLEYENEFDAVIFYSSLHHSDDEGKAIKNAYRALKENGVFIAIEPGLGHERRAKEVIAKYDVGDRDMPPYLVAKRGKEIGFKKTKFYVHSGLLLATVYKHIPKNRAARLVLSVPGIKLFVFLFFSLFYKRYSGIVRMVK